MKKEFDLNSLDAHVFSEQRQCPVCGSDRRGDCDIPFRSNRYVQAGAQYLGLDERLVFLLEAIGAHLEPLGWDAGDIFVMSGYRTPYYNKQLDDTKYSLHQWGRAADIFLDKDDNGRMDDFNNDKVISREDAVALAAVLEGLAKTPELSSFIGGLGIYGATAAHGPFVHVDTRPSRARW